MVKLNSSGFKLIGIRAHKNCHSNFTKVLEPGKLYQFYNEFKFYNENDEIFESSDQNINGYKKELIVPEDLYNIDDLNINISAIVGKNGSGKSTLIELLLYCIYVLGTTLKNEKSEQILKPHYQKLIENINLNQNKIDLFQTKKNELELFFEKNNLIIDKNKVKDNEGFSKEFKSKLEELLNYDFQINDLLKNKKIWEENIELSRKEHEFIVDNLKCSLYFELDDVVWEFKTHSNEYVNINNNEKKVKESSKAKIREIKILNLIDSSDHNILNYLFYTIMLNYSHHALNSKHIGFWINTLFHKNDGYKTPAVINPMRIEGNFDINIENSLAKSRLLINLLIEALHNNKKKKKINLTEKQYIYKVRFKYDKSKDIVSKIKFGSYGSSNQNENFIVSGDINNVNLVQELLPLYFEGFSEVYVQNRDVPYSIILINYVIGKINKILNNYPEYDSNQKYDNLINYFRDVLPILKKDQSHVTFKIERSMFFLKKMLNDKIAKLWNLENEFIEFDLYELLEWMEIKDENDLYLIFERIPPSIFDIEFIIDGKENNVEYDFEEKYKLPRLHHLSSGEQHKIHTINSIVYHLNNIFSVHNSSSSTNRIKYNYVNIIFDEIELYFHPDLQRQFINDLLSNLERLKYITKDPNQRIKGLNFLFSTHSPFILSDIPSQNILKIEYDSIKENAVQILDNNQTFGANIHDLLSNSFFFKEKTFTGEKSNLFLKELILEIKNLKSNAIFISKDYSNLMLRKAGIIGEPFFKIKLQEMIIEQTNNENDEKINMMIEQKRKEIDELEKIKKKDQK